MQIFRLCFIALLCSLVTGLSFDLFEAKAKPIKKVLDLLKQIQVQTEQESSADAETYKKYRCWCQTTGEMKKEALNAAEARLKSMTSRVEELNAVSHRLRVEITPLEKDVKNSRESIEKATLIRKKAIEKFTAQESLLLEQVNTLSRAEKILSSGSFLQLPQADSLHLEMALSDQLDLLSNDDFATMSAFLQEGAPRDMRVLVVLSSLREDFGEKLKKLRNQEARESATFEKLMKAQRDQLDSATTQTELKKQEKANAEEQLARNTQDIKDTKASMTADAAVLKEVKEKCSNVDKEYDERIKTRTEEAQAVAKALEILTDDENNDRLNKALSFLQTSQSQSLDTRRERAAALLMSAGEQDVRLITMAMRVKLDNVESVKESIETMIQALKREQADEDKHNDFCKDQFVQGKVLMQEKTGNLNSQEAELATLMLKLNQSDKVIQTFKAEINEMRKQLLLASKNREQQNQNFQGIVSDQRESQMALKQAVTVLKDFYKKKRKAALVQENIDESALAKEEQTPADEPAKGFKPMSKGAGIGIISMLDQLISDSKAVEKEALAAESSAQLAYESFAKDTKAARAKKDKAIVDESDTKARYEQAFLQAEQTKRGTKQELNRLVVVEADLHSSCDFLMKNFKVRQKARKEEVDALKQAKSFLGSKSFLNRSN